MTDAPDPRFDPGLVRTFAGYKAALAQMTRQQLLDQLTSINAQLEAQARRTFETAISSPLSESIQSLDRLQTRSLPTGRPTSDPARGAAASQPSALQQPSALDLLAKSRYMGPRLAAKLVAADARSRKRKGE